MTGHRDLAPSPWVVRFAHLVAPGTRVLDLAAGQGRHARFFADRGAQVLAIDRDSLALSALSGVANVETRVLDLETGRWPLPGERFGAIVVVNYLHRALFAHLRAALSPDGVLLYETFAMGNEAYGRPSNPDFLLCRDELLTVAALPPAPLTVVAFEQGRVDDGARQAVVQRLAAVGSQAPEPSSLTPALPLRER
jgi:SAM-dependent methyltransferase